MLGRDRHSTADGLGRRIAALKDELDHLQSAFRHRESGWERLASDAQDWVAERAEALPHLSLDAIRRQMERHVEPTVRAVPPAVPVIAAAVAVGVGVGCVLYAVASRGKSRSGSTKSGVRRPASRTVE